MYVGQQSAGAYQRTGVETQVLEADSHRLILLLFSGLLQRLRLAEACVIKGELGRKAKAASEAGAIIGSLSASLDFRAGGDIAQRLESIYEYCAHRLVQANAHNNAAAFAEVAQLIGEIRSAWVAIRVSEAEQ